ncbi:unnamed protein product [Medioppia subpectinata]|uniref:valine--tRNA ligase n=1 Tax=Medioppia subpectinata TaxID=1979941 RepID=A0A7R9KWJ6_9ACAR|nr:unnamed protein product [Medioppia subpectinata]CAG2110843.1 unnamed protein product [Medioppia subpectinata]
MTHSFVTAGEALVIARRRHPSADIQVRQDTDVLDTWFSAALLPLSVNGWPQRDPTADNDQHFPLSLMETGRDIIFFWVARMVIMSLSLTGRLPFRRVLLHGMVADSDGRKMSKSRGNVIDPSDVIDGVSLDALKAKCWRAYDQGLLSDKELAVGLDELAKRFPKGVLACGADALRLHLLETRFKEESVAFDAKQVVMCRNFCNKLHQTVRFFAANVDQSFSETDILTLMPYLTPTDRWILSELVAAVQSADQCIQAYDLSVAAHRLNHFWHHQLCDVYVEHMKTVLRPTDDQQSAATCADQTITARNCSLNVFVVCVRTALRALHPFMPFITENLWQHMRRLLATDGRALDYNSIVDERYPDGTADQWMKAFDYAVGDDMRTVEAVIQQIRSLRQTYKLPKSLLREKTVLLATNGQRLDSYRRLIASAAAVRAVELVSVHDIHRYDSYLCFKVDVTDGESDGQRSGTTSSDDSDSPAIDDNCEHRYDDCYLLVDVDTDFVRAQLSVSGVKHDVVDTTARELERYKCHNFHQNYWKTSSMRRRDKS